MRPGRRNLEEIYGDVERVDLLTGVAGGDQARRALPSRTRRSASSSSWPDAGSRATGS